jgi:hypothetical protein
MELTKYIFCIFALATLIGCGDSTEDEELLKIDLRKRIEFTEVSTDDIDSLTYFYDDVDFAEDAPNYMDLRVLIRNRGEKPIWIHGGHVERPHYSLEYWDDEANSWINSSPGFCGTGARNYALIPGGSRKMSVYIGHEFLERKFRVGLSLSMSPTAYNRVTVWSSPFKLVDGPKTDITLKKRD